MAHMGGKASKGWMASQPIWIRKQRQPTAEEYTSWVRSVKGNCKRYAAAYPLSVYNGKCSEFILSGGHCGKPFVERALCSTGVSSKADVVRPRWAGTRERKRKYDREHPNYVGQNASKSSKAGGDSGRTITVGGVVYPVDSRTPVTPEVPMSRKAKLELLATMDRKIKHERELNERRIQMSLNQTEQETIINFDEAGSKATVYTCNKNLAITLKESGAKMTEHDKESGSWTFELDKKKILNALKGKIRAHREWTDEARQAVKERLVGGRLANAKAALKKATTKAEKQELIELIKKLEARLATPVGEVKAKPAKKAKKVAEEVEEAEETPKKTAKKAAKKPAKDADEDLDDSQLPDEDAGDGLDDDTPPAPKAKAKKGAKKAAKEDDDDGLS